MRRAKTPADPARQGLVDSEALWLQARDCHAKGDFDFYCIVGARMGVYSLTRNGIATCQSLEVIFC